MSILTLGSKKKKERKFPIKEKAKKEGKEIPNQRVGERKKKRKKLPNQRMGEIKKRRKLLVKETKRNVQKGLWTGQYLRNTGLSPNEHTRRKGNHDLKWSSPFDYQPKSRALATFSPRTKQKQKKKKPKTHKNRNKKPPKEPISKGSPIDP